MTQTASNVAAANPDVLGGMAVAPKGTALPTDATTALDPAFKRLGYLSVEGIVPADEAAQTEAVYAFGGDMVAELETQGSIKRYTAKLIEVYNAEVQKFLHGEDNVQVTAATTEHGTQLAVQDKGESIDDCVVVFDLRYKGKRKRVVIPLGQPLVTAEDPMVHTAVQGHEVQVTCQKDDSGVRQYVYYENDDVASA